MFFAVPREVSGKLRTPAARRKEIAESAKIVIDENRIKCESPRVEGNQSETQPNKKMKTKNNQYEAAVSELLSASEAHRIGDMRIRNQALRNTLTSKQQQVWLHEVGSATPEQAARKALASEAY